MRMGVGVEVDGVGGESCFDWKDRMRVRENRRGTAEADACSDGVEDASGSIEGRFEVSLTGGTKSAAIFLVVRAEMALQSMKTSLSRGSSTLRSARRLIASGARLASRTRTAVAVASRGGTMLSRTSTAATSSASVS